MPKQILYLLAVLLSSCTTPSIIATRNVQQGDASNNSNKYDEAIKHYTEYLRLAPQLGLYRNPTKEADVCRKLAHAYSTQGKYSSSKRFLLKALAIDTTLADNRLNIIEDYRQLGLVNAFQGNFLGARKYLSRSLKLSEGMESSSKNIQKSIVADTHLSLAQVQLSTGDLQESARNAQRAFFLYLEIEGETVGLMEAQLVSGILARERGDLDEAIRQLQQSQERARKSQLNTARQTQALGEVYFLQGEWEEGLRFQLTALSEAERSHNKPQIIMATIRTGDAYQRLGDLRKANQYYRKALQQQNEIQEDSSSLLPSLKMRLGNVQQAYDIFERSGSALGAALASLRLGELFQERKRTDSAVLMLDKAKTYFAQAGSPEGMARTYLAWGRVLTEKGDVPQAMRFFQLAISLSHQPDLTWKCLYEIGQLLELNGNPDSARLTLRKSIEVIESIRGNLSVEEFKTLFSASNSVVYDKLIMLLLKNAPKWNSLSADSAMREAFDYNERARSRTFLDMLGNSRIEPKSSKDESLLDEEQMTRLKIHQLSIELQKVKTSDETYTPLIHELQESEMKHRDLLEKIKLSNPAYGSLISIAPPSVSEIQNSLDDQTAIVEYWMSKSEMVVWVIDRKKIQAQVVKIGESQLSREITFARQVIAARIEVESQKSLKSLYANLIKPVESSISKYPKLIIVPHKSLHFLPFQALLNEQNRYFVESKSSTFFAPSAGVLYYCLKRKAESGNKFYGLALGSEAIGTFEGLPGTESEINQISKLYSEVNTKTKKDFTETTFKKDVGQFNYTHIATHGVFNIRQPLYSYILMHPSAEDDGRLSVHEIFSLDVRSKLVTLSACETGMGELNKGDELVGLSRALLYSGASAVIVSLWKVDDASTAFLMTRFYQYITSGKQASESLTLAQRDLLHRDTDGKLSKKELQPYYWAPFVLIGNGFVE